VTCRDWFQLTLKEGLTVFRDEEFTADMTSRAVKRITDVSALRTMQFAEDAGPTAHPVRPESYVKMDNFYTSTVYDKGATVVRMYQTLLGVDGFRKGIDLYFERHDGRAVTCDDFLAAMADANGVDLSVFGRWYSQAGTPVLRAKGGYDREARTYTLTLAQSFPPPHDKPNAKPLHIPVAVGLLGASGADLALVLDGEPQAGTTAVLDLVEREATYVFTDVAERPVPSILRDFSAPVKLEMVRERSELAFLAANDSDPFNRWEALQTLARDVLLELAAQSAAGADLVLDPGLRDAVGEVLADPRLDGALAALALVLPSERELAQAMAVVDPDALFAARAFARRALAEAHAETWRATYEANRDPSYSNDRRAIARRSIKNVALAYLTSLETSDTVALASRQFDVADNMTDSFAALAILSGIDHPERRRTLDAFYAKWKDEELVVDKWFAVQAGSPVSDTFDRVVELSRHPDFNLENPNRARSLLRTFTANQVHFHRADGAAYRFHSERVLALDALNPQIASRLVAAFNPWRRFDVGRQALMRAELERILGHEGLSKDVFEIASQALGE
jgi:aminopeptidase N